MSGVARSRHQLATLLHEAYQNKEMLEERIAEGKRNRKEAGNKYGTWCWMLKFKFSSLCQQDSEGIIPSQLLRGYKCRLIICTTVIFQRISQDNWMLYSTIWSDMIHKWCYSTDNKRKNNVRASTSHQQRILREAMSVKPLQLDKISRTGDGLGSF